MYGLNGAANIVYLDPLIQTLGVVANLTVDSQVQFYAGLAFEPEKLHDQNEFIVPMDKLPGFVNSAEWNLGTFKFCFLTTATAIISYPVINFILYVPHPDFRPLHLESTQSKSQQNSFFLPQWGGIQILNPTPGTKHLDIASLRPGFSTFITHLLSLLGTPALSDSIPAEGRVILSPWQLDGLVRQRAAENLVAAGGTMGSLARLVRKIPNMAIPQEIRSDVLLTLSHLDKVPLC
jgi:GPI-anchor transamidase subunit S